MEGFAYILIFLTVFLTTARADKNCFYNKISECFMLSMGQTTPLVLPVDFSLCEYKNTLFKCLHKKLKKCSEEQKYDFSELEKLYDGICTVDTQLNKQMKEYSSCYKEIVLNSAFCTQKIMDLLESAEDVGPEFLETVNKKVCRESRNIMHCYYDVIEEKCGKDARQFVETVFRASENLNNAFCEDILNNKNTAPFF